MSSNVRTDFIVPDLLATSPNWSPRYFVGPASVALRASQHGFSVGEVDAEAIEGWRFSATPGTVSFDPAALGIPVYRQSNIDGFRLRLDPAHWNVPSVEMRWCVLPGDVVVSKFPPLRAAVASPGVRRHPVDGNSILVRGLPLATATWLAACLNRREYEQLLLIESGVQPRIGLGAILKLRIPPVPDEFEVLALSIRELQDDQLRVGEALHRLREEVNLTSVDPFFDRDLRQGMFFESESMSVESWLPAAAVVRSEHQRLTRNYEWVPIRDLATSSSRIRNPISAVGGGAVRLSDVGDDLFVSPMDLDSIATGIGLERLLSDPLIAGEVLVSGVGRNCRVAYVDDGIGPRVFAIDAWVRFRFRETPAAWALLLCTPHVQWQVARLAIGTVQQFVPLESLLSVHVPVPERETRDRWQRGVERHHAQRRIIDQRWEALMSEVRIAFDRAHGIDETRRASIEVKS